MRSVFKFQIAFFGLALSMFCLAAMPSDQIGATPSDQIAIQDFHSHGIACVHQRGAADDTANSLAFPDVVALSPVLELILSKGYKTNAPAVYQNPVADVLTRVDKRLHLV